MMMRFFDQRANKIGKIAKKLNRIGDVLSDENAETLGKCCADLFSLKNDIRFKISFMVSEENANARETKEELNRLFQQYSFVEKLCAHIGELYFSMHENERVIFWENMGVENPSLMKEEFDEVLNAVKIDKAIFGTIIAYMLQNFMLDTPRELLKKTAHSFEALNVPLIFTTKVINREEALPLTEFFFDEEKGEHKHTEILATFRDKSEAHRVEVFKMDENEYQEYIKNELKKGNKELLKKLYVTIPFKEGFTFLLGIDAERRIRPYLSDGSILMMHELGHAFSYSLGEALDYENIIRDYATFYGNAEEIRNINHAQYSENACDEQLKSTMGLVRFGHKYGVYFSGKEDPDEMSFLLLDIRRITEDLQRNLNIDISDPKSKVKQLSDYVIDRYLKDNPSIKQRKK